MALVASGGAMCICLVMAEFSWGSVFRPIFVQGILTTTRGSTIPTVLVLFVAEAATGGNSEAEAEAEAEIE